MCWSKPLCKRYSSREACNSYAMPWCYAFRDVFVAWIWVDFECKKRQQIEMATKHVFKTEIFWSPADLLRISCGSSDRSQSISIDLKVHAAVALALQQIVVDSDRKSSEASWQSENTNEKSERTKKICKRKRERKLENKRNRFDKKKNRLENRFRERTHRKRRKREKE